jgi:hypothetical protein
VAVARERERGEEEEEERRRERKRKRVFGVRIGMKSQMRESMLNS